MISKPGFLFFFIITTVTFDVYSSYNSQSLKTTFEHHHGVNFEIDEHCQYPESTKNSILKTLAVDAKALHPNCLVTLHLSISYKPKADDSTKIYRVKRSIIAIAIKQNHTV